MLRILTGFMLVALAVLAIWPFFGAPWIDEEVVREKVIEVEVTATQEPTTAVVFYQPGAVDAAQAQDAECWASLTSSLRGLRCSSDSQIHDPCFVHGESTVVCPGEGPELCAVAECPTVVFNASIEGSDLPLPWPGIGTNPWRLELADGTTYRFVSGATAVYNGQRLNYSCTDDAWVYGLPEQGELWTVWKAQFEPVAGAFTPVGEPVNVAVLTAWY